MQKLALGLLMAVVVGVVIAAAWHDRELAVDDAYITFRFAENLRLGHGLRWNPQSPPCEGYSNLSYVLGLAGLGALGLGPITSAWLMASMGIATLGLLLWRAATPAGRLAPLALGPALLLLTADETRIHGSRGLETCLFAGLCALQVAAAARLCATAHRTTLAAISTGAVGIGLFLTRPDGVLVTTMSLTGAAWLTRGDAAHRRGLAIATTTWLLGGALYALVKWRVFGYLLPNPFYMKSGGSGFAGLQETWAFVRAHAVLLATLLVITIWRAPDWFGARRRRNPPPDATTFLCTLTALAWLAYSSKIVHEIGFAYRFTWPAAALMALGTVRGLAEVAGRLPTTRAGAQSIAWLIFAGFAGSTWPNLRQHVADLSAPRKQDPYTHMFLRLGNAIAATGIADQLMLYCTHAGATPFASRAHHVDRAGLVDDGYCLRTPQAQRNEYEARVLTEIDVVSWHLFPAAPGSTAFDNDARALGSRYLNEWCLGLPADMDVALRQGLARQDLELRKTELYAFMRVFRDAATLVGEMRTHQQRWRTFVYVWKASPHHDRLVAHLAKYVDIAAGEIDYDGWPK